jgi:hypothetical protein
MQPFAAICANDCNRYIARRRLERRRRRGRSAEFNATGKLCGSHPTILVAPAVGDVLIVVDRCFDAFRFL